MLGVCFAAVHVGTLNADGGVRLSKGDLDRLGVPPADLSRMDIRGGAPLLRVDNIRLEAPPADTPQPSTLLKFDMLNEDDRRVTDIQIQIAIVDKQRFAADQVGHQVIVGPFTILGHATIEAGSTVNYEMLLRNLSLDCHCRADVRVIAARPLVEPRDSSPSR